MKLKLIKILVTSSLIALITSCGGGGGGSSESATNPTDSGATVFPGGSLDDLKALSASLNFNNLTITGKLSLPVPSNETITVNNLTVTSAGSIGYNYSTCEYVSAPGIAINATKDVVIDGEILLNGRSGTSVTSGASCNSCYGQDGGNVAITALNISIGVRLLNYGGSGGTYRDVFGSSGCSGGDSGHTTLKANSINLSNATIETHGGRGGAEGFGYGPSGADGDVSLTTSGLFKMNPGSISSDGILILNAGQTDIIGPITYGTLNANIGGDGDVTYPTATILAPLSGMTVVLDQPLEVQVQASDVGMGVREVDISGFGYSATHSAAEMLNGILTVQILGPTPDIGLQATVRDNVGFETVASVSGLTISYGPELEPNDSPATAQVVTLPVAISGSISTTDLGTCDLTIATGWADPNCFYHTAQDYYAFTVPKDGNVTIELEFEGNQALTDLDIYLDYSSSGSGWWSSSINDNAGTGVYVETIDAYLFTPDTFTIAIQAWPTWSGTASYRLTIRKAP